jgi:Mg/Co/Ni transporter MgtE
MTTIDGSRPRLLNRRYLVRLVLINLIAATSAVALVAGFGLLSRLSDVGYALATSLIYAYTIGSLCGFTLPFVAVAMERRPALVRFSSVRPV